MHNAYPPPTCNAMHLFVSDNSRTNYRTLVVPHLILREVWLRSSRNLLAFHLCINYRPIPHMQRYAFISSRNLLASTHALITGLHGSTYFVYSVSLTSCSCISEHTTSRIASVVLILSLLTLEASCRFKIKDIYKLVHQEVRGRGGIIKEEEVPYFIHTA